jgi:hypothetical protein
MNALCETFARNERRPSVESGEVRPFDPLADPEWDRLVASHPDAGFFHSAAWARVLVRTYGHRPFYLACHRGGRLTALVPVMEVCSSFTGRRGVCVPFADFCNPLFFGQGRPVDAMEALSNLARERCWRHFEIRGGPRLGTDAGAAASFLAHSLDLRAGPERLFAKLDSSVRRAVRKGERAGLKVEVRTDREAMLAFYRLHTRTRRRHGLPPQPLAFFLNIHDEVIRTGFGVLVLAFDGSTPVAGAVFFHHSTQAVYKFGASDERLQAMRANNLVMWAGIRFLAEHGFESLHFGRTDRTDDGLRRYKLGWGTTESDLEYFRFDPRAGSWAGGRAQGAGMHQAVFSRLPLAVNRLLGRLLYPHLD